MIQQSPKFLILKTSSLGDIIHTFPVVSYLKQKFPTCQIDWIVEKPFIELLLSHPKIDTVIPVDTKKWRKSLFKKKTWGEIKNFRKNVKKNIYDYVFDLQGNTKSGLILNSVLAKTKIGFGRKTVAEWPNLLFTQERFNPPLGKNIREDYLFVVQSFFKDYLPLVTEALELKIASQDQEKVDDILQGATGRTVLVCPGARWGNKELPLPKLQQALQTLAIQKETYFLFSWGNEEEKKRAQTLLDSFFPKAFLLPYLKLPVLQYLMRHVDLVLAMDSLPLHLCGITETSSLAFFGPSSPEKYQPLGEQHHCVRGSCPYHQVFEKRCSKLRTCPTGACLRELDEVKIRQHIDACGSNCGLKD